MSEQIANNSWIKLSEIFNSLDEDCIKKATKEYRVKEICVDGITSKIYGKKDVEWNTFPKLLLKMGFSIEEIEKFRLCVIGDCKYTTDIYGMLNHFIGYHEVPAQNIGKLVIALKDDSRKLPGKGERIKYNLTHPQMSTD